MNAMTTIHRAETAADQIFDEAADGARVRALPHCLTTNFIRPAEWRFWRAAIRQRLECRHRAHRFGVTVTASAFA